MKLDARRKFNLAFAALLRCWLDNDGHSFKMFAKRASISPARFGALLRGSSPDCWEFREITNQLSLPLGIAYMSVDIVVQRTEKAVEALNSPECGFEETVKLAADAVATQTKAKRMDEVLLVKCSCDVGRCALH